MKRGCNRSLLLPLLLLIFALPAFAQQWEECGLRSIDTRLMTSDGNNLYAIMNGAIYCSTDEGVYWERRGRYTSIPDQLIFVDGNLFILISDAFGMTGKVLMSSDGGWNWTTIYYNNPVQTISIDTSVIFLGTAMGVHISTNAGSTWYEPTNGIIRDLVSSVLVNDSLLIAGFVSRAMIRSTDLGKTWSSTEFIWSDIPSKGILMTKSNRNLYLLTKSPMRVFHSSDQGQTWTTSTDSLSIPPVNTFEAKGDSLYIITTYAAYISTDHGKSWKGIPNERVPYSESYKIERGVVVGSTLLFHYPFAWLRVLNDGKEAELMPTGSFMGSTLVRQSDAELIVVQPYNKTLHLYRSTDHGTTWRVIVANPSFGTSPPSGGLFYCKLFDSLGFCIYKNNNTYNLYRTTNLGWSWSSVSGASTQNEPVAITRWENKIVYIRTELTPPMYSTDSGRTWKQHASIFPRDLVEGVSDDPPYYAFMHNRGAYAAQSNTELPWVSINGNRAQSLGVKKFARNGSTICVLNSDDRLDFTRDDGAFWRELVPAFAASDVQAIAVQGPWIFCSTTSDVFASSNEGVTWKSIREGLPTTTLNQLWCVGPYLYAQSPAGNLYRRLDNLTSVEEQETETPERFALKQNYPNPFAEETRIDLTPALSYEEREFRIFDLFGREVLDLSEQARNATQIVIHRSQLPRAGVYFYRLSTGNLTQTKIMIAQ